MKNILAVAIDRFVVLFLGAIFMVSPALLWAKDHELPVPILSDAAANAQAMLAAEQSAKRWVIQLGAGSATVLADQANQLRADWADARVITIQNQSKLVVGSWASPAEASTALKSLRLINAQAFVRQLPSAAVVTRLAAAPAVSNKPKPVPKVAVLPQLPLVSAVVEPEKAVPSVVEPEVAAAKDAVKDDDVLPAIVAVAIATQPELMLETPALQAAAESLENDTAVGQSDNVVLAKQPAVADSLLEQPEKRGIVLPMRSKESAEFKPVRPLDEPLNLMLSPLYFLSDDAAGQARNPQALSMQTVLEALVRPNLVATVPTAKSVTVAQPDPVLVRKAKLFARMAELANEGLWEMALPLVKEAKLKDMQLSSVDNLLLGWIWLQNKELRIAKGYFQNALAQSPQDEARYALGLSSLLLGDKAATQQIMKEMSAGRQKDHLRSLLLR